MNMDVAMVTLHLYGSKWDLMDVPRSPVIMNFSFKLYKSTRTGVAALSKR